MRNDYGFDYYGYPPYGNFGPQQKQEAPSKVAGWVFIILASIIAALSVLAWRQFYRGVGLCGGEIVQAIDEYTKMFTLYAGGFLIHFVLTIVANSKFSAQKKFYGRSFSIIAGRAVTIIEYGCYIASFVLILLK